MRSGTLIPLARPDRLLKKTSTYLTDMERFLSDPSTAVSVMLNTLPHADSAMLLKMLPLLGCAGKDRVLWPLYHLMLEESRDETVRTAAAVQLALAASMSVESAALREALTEKLDHPEPHVRSCCAVALGWESNWTAVSALVARLDDTDRDVQSAVVAALSAVGDDRVFDLLKERLDIGTTDEKRIILLHLWRFAKQRQKVETIYLGCMTTADPGLCLDILDGLSMIPLSTSILDLYGRLLVDKDARIRLKVLDNLTHQDPVAVHPLNGLLRSLLEDDDACIRQAVMRILRGSV